MTARKDEIGSIVLKAENILCKYLGANNKEINYKNLVERILLMIADPRFKELEIYKIFCGFFSDKYKEEVQKAVQFQAAVDYLLSKTKGECL